MELQGVGGERRIWQQQEQQQREMKTRQGQEEKQTYKQITKAPNEEIRGTHGRVEESK